MDGESAATETPLLSGRVNDVSGDERLGEMEMMGT